MTEHRPEALARLDVFVGEWVTEARFPSDHPAAANAYIQHYYDSRGVARLSAMSLAGVGWEHDFALTYPRAD